MPSYSPYGYQYPQYGQNMPTQQLQNVQQLPQPQMHIQNGGLVSVHNELEARNYPIAIGTSITFKDENAPYVYTKTMGFSQLESPRFDKYRLVKEDTSETSNQPQIEPLEQNPISTTIKDLKGEIEAIWSEIEGIKKKASTKPAATSKKKEVVEDDES